MALNARKGDAEYGEKEAEIRGLCRAWEWNCLQIHSGDHVHRHLISVCHVAAAAIAVAVADRKQKSENTKQKTEQRSAHI